MFKKFLNKIFPKEEHYIFYHRGFKVEFAPEKTALDNPNVITMTDLGLIGDTNVYRTRFEYFDEDTFQLFGLNSDFDLGDLSENEELNSKRADLATECLDELIDWIEVIKSNT